MVRSGRNVMEDLDVYSWLTSRPAEPPKVPLRPYTRPLLPSPPACCPYWRSIELAERKRREEILVKEEERRRQEEREAWRRESEKEEDEEQSHNSSRSEGSVSLWSEGTQAALCEWSRGTLTITFLTPARQGPRCSELAVRLLNQ